MLAAAMTVSSFAGLFYLHAACCSSRSTNSVKALKDRPLTGIISGLLNDAISDDFELPSC